MARFWKMHNEKLNDVLHLYGVGILVDKKMNRALLNFKTVILGDFNPKIGKGAVEPWSDSFGLSERNERGELLELCQS